MVIALVGKGVAQKGAREHINKMRWHQENASTTTQPTILKANISKKGQLNLPNDGHACALKGIINLARYLLCSREDSINPLH